MPKWPVFTCDPRWDEGKPFRGTSAHRDRRSVGFCRCIQIPTKTRRRSQTPSSAHLTPKRAAESQSKVLRGAPKTVLHIPSNPSPHSHLLVLVDFALIHGLSDLSLENPPTIPSCLKVCCRCRRGSATIGVISWTLWAGTAIFATFVCTRLSRSLVPICFLFQPDGW